MSVRIPSSFGFDLDVDLDGDLDVTIPTSYNISIPTSYGISIRELPQIDINLRPVEIRPLDISLRLKEIPSIRAHIPLNYKVGFSLLGRELVCINLCGQGQFITEPYIPYPCEPRQSKPRPEGLAEWVADKDAHSN